MEALKQIPLGIAYAIWGGLGIVLTALISVFVFKQSLDILVISIFGLASRRVFKFKNSCYQ